MSPSWPHSRRPQAQGIRAVLVAMGGAEHTWGSLCACLISHCEQHPLFPAARTCHQRLSSEAGFKASALGTEKFPLWEMGFYRSTGFSGVPGKWAAADALLVCVCFVWIRYPGASGDLLGDLLGGPISDSVFSFSQQQKLPRSLPPSTCTSQKLKRMFRAHRLPWPPSRTWDTPQRVVRAPPASPTP